MSRLVFDFDQKDEKVLLIVHAEITTDWQEIGDGFGYFGVKEEEYEGDDFLKVQVWVDERPYRHVITLAELQDETVRAPANEVTQPNYMRGRFSPELKGFGLSPSKAVGFRLNEGVLTVSTYMLNVENCHRSNGQPGLFENDIRIAAHRNVEYRMRFFANVRERARRRPDFIEWDLLPYPSAGLPGLGRRG